MQSKPAIFRSGTDECDDYKQIKRRLCFPEILHKYRWIAEGTIRWLLIALAKTSLCGCGFERACSQKPRAMTELPNNDPETQMNRIKRADGSRIDCMMRIQSYFAPTVFAQHIFSHRSLYHRVRVWVDQKANVTCSRNYNIIQVGVTS
jgi:hypothetical protein